MKKKPMICTTTKPTATSSRNGNSTSNHLQGKRGGFVMAATGYLKANPNPTRQELAHGVSGNLCRCQDYDKILTAMMRGADYARKG